MYRQWGVLSSIIYLVLFRRYYVAESFLSGLIWRKYRQTRDYKRTYSFTPMVSSNLRLAWSSTCVHHAPSVLIVNYSTLVPHRYIGRFIISHGLRNAKVMRIVSGVCIEECVHRHRNSYVDQKPYLQIHTHKHISTYRYKETWACIPTSSMPITFHLVVEQPFLRQYLLGRLSLPRLQHEESCIRSCWPSPHGMSAARQLPVDGIVDRRNIPLKKYTAYWHSHTKPVVLASWVIVTAPKKRTAPKRPTV